MKTGSLLEQDLEKVQLPKKHKLPFPIGHLTTLGNLEIIFKNAMIKPQKGKNFKDPITYCSYGSISYVKKEEATPSNLPVGLIFNSNLVDYIQAYYPIDTGAFHSESLFGEWKNNLGNIDNFRVDSSSKTLIIPQKLIFSLYGSHENYCKGEVRGNHKFEHLVSENLRQFLRESSLNIPSLDHRALTIECHILKKFNCLEHLETIILPQECIKDYESFLRRYRHVIKGTPPVTELYAYHTRDTPESRCKHVISKARDYIKNKYLDQLVG